MKAWIVEMSVPDHFNKADIITAANIGIRIQHEATSSKELKPLDYNSNVSYGPYFVRKDYD